MRMEQVKTKQQLSINLGSERDGKSSCGSKKTWDTKKRPQSPTESFFGWFMSMKKQIF